MNKRDYFQENIEKLVGKTGPELAMGEQTKENILNNLIEEADKLSSATTVKKYARWVAAAGAIAAAIMAMFVLNRSITPAYAIDQTLKALQKISTVHTIGTNWDGKRFEVWNKFNMETGKAEWVCIDETPHGSKIASTPKGSCIWDANGNVIKLTNRIISSNDSRYEYLFQEMSDRMTNPRDGEKFSIYREKDKISGKVIIVIWAVTKIKDYKVYIDPVTRLPIRINFDRADNMQQICKSIEQFNYNVELPEGMFDFEIPEDSVRDYSVLKDPDKGIPAEALTHEEASVQIAEKYWTGAIEGKWDVCRQMAPMDRSWKTGFRKNPPIAIIEIKQPYSARGCSGLITPCVIKYKDGKVKEIGLVVNYHEINGKVSAIIVASWGKAKVLEQK